MTIQNVSGNFGGKTVYANGKYISVSAEQVKAQAERRLAQAAEKAAKKAAKTGKVTVFDAAKNLHVSATPAEAKAIVSANKSLEEVAIQTVKKPGILKKVAKFGLIGLGIAGLIGGGLLLLNKCTNKKSETVNTEPNVVPTKPTKPAKPQTPVNPPINSEENQENPNVEEKDKKYKVKKGDCLWNIAKQFLIDEHKKDSNYKPTNKEILDKTEELIKLNNKEYEKPLPKDSRKRNVKIFEDEEIKLTA